MGLLNEIKVTTDTLVATNEFNYCYHEHFLLEVTT